MRVASFNLNNLFDAYNFAVQLDHEPTRDEIAAAAVNVVPHGDAEEPEDAERLGRAERSSGDLVRPKDPAARRRIADRIRGLDADVLLVQEVEHRDALREFNRLAVV